MWPNLNDNIRTFGPMEDIMQVLYLPKKHKIKATHLNGIDRFYVHKEVSFDNLLYNKHIFFPNINFDTTLKNDTFHPTLYLMPSIFNIPIHFSPTPQSYIMPFLPSVGFQYSHSALNHIISAQQWAAFTHNVQYTAPYKYTVNNFQAHINTVLHVELRWQFMWDIITFK